MYELTLQNYNQLLLYVLIIVHAQFIADITEPYSLLIWVSYFISRSVHTQFYVSFANGAGGVGNF